MDDNRDCEDDRIPTSEEKAEMRRQKLIREMQDVDVSEVEDDLKAQASNQHVRKMSKKTLERVKDAHLVKVEYSRTSEGLSSHGSVEVVDDDNPYKDEISALARRTPEVRFTKAQMLRPFSDDELKVIAASLLTGVAMYRVADSLHCSTRKIKDAIEAIPILTELAQERNSRRKEQAQEAVDDCVKARVPAVVMWNAEHLLPEVYGDQSGIDEEDDTRLVIGGLTEEQLAEADRLVEEANAKEDDLPMDGNLQCLMEERAAEEAAAGSGIPLSPIDDVSPAPAIKPPEGDARFGKFVPAAKMGRVPGDSEVATPQFGFGEFDGYGGFGMGMDVDGPF